MSKEGTAVKSKILQQGMLALIELVKKCDNTEEIFHLMGSMLPLAVFKEVISKEVEELPILEKKTEEMIAKLRAGEPLYKVLDLQDNFVEQVYAEGYRLYRSGLYSKALSYFDAAFLLDQRRATFMLGIAACQQRMKHYEEAIESYKKLAELAPEVPLPFFYIYECYLEIKDPEAAKEALKEALRRAEASPRYKEQKGQAELLLEGHDVRFAGINEEAPPQL